MVYVEIPHVGDDDVDLLCFTNIMLCAKYLVDNKESTFIIKTEDCLDFNVDEYTFVEVS